MKKNFFFWVIHTPCIFSDYSFTMKKDFEAAGTISVSHMGINGRICGKNWDDVDARIFCRGMNYPDGFAYFHSYETVSVA